MSATDDLRRMLDERGVEYEAYRDVKNRCITKWRTYHGAFVFFAVEKEGKLFVETASDTEHSAICTPEQAIAATLGRPKAKAHPYGYEPDTGAFDCTRCECGCINDISATYCNDCGGEIEIDMYAEKEIYHIPCHLVFAEKHDDGSLEFGGKRYVAATLGSGTCENVNTDGYGFYFECSECGYSTIVHNCAVRLDELPKFCPECGCKVRKAVDE